jgi:hypothetical protein
MPQYAAIIYTRDADCAFGAANGEKHIRGGAALFPTSTATTVRVKGGRGGEVVTSDGPYAEAKEVLTGFFILECTDLDEAIRVAAQIPSAREGAIEVRPVIPMG